MGTDDLFNKLTVRMAEEIADIAVARVTEKLETLLRSNIKVIYDDESAAAFLETSKANVVEWANRGLLEHAVYPVGRLRDGEDDRLGNHRTYSIAALLSFRDKYLRKTTGGNRYEINPVLTLVGPEVEDKRMVKAA